DGVLTGNALGRQNDQALGAATEQRVAVPDGEIRSAVLEPLNRHSALMRARTDDAGRPSFARKPLRLHALGSHASRVLAWRGHSVHPQLESRSLPRALLLIKRNRPVATRRRAESSITRSQSCARRPTCSGLARARSRPSFTARTKLVWLSTPTTFMPGGAAR